MTGTETPMLGADWHPVVDPTSVWVAAWEGTVRAGPDGLSMVPASGRLVIHPFQPMNEQSASASPADGPSGSPAASPADSPSGASPSPAGSAEPGGSTAPGGSIAPG